MSKSHDDVLMPFDEIKITKIENLIIRLKILIKNNDSNRF